MPRKRRSFRVLSRRRQRLRSLLTFVFIAVAAASLFVLVRYGLDWLHSSQQTQEMKALYLSTASPQNTPFITQTPVASPKPDQPTPQILPTIAPQAAALPTATAYPWLSNYPHNPHRNVSANIQKMQRQTKDVVGWLHVEQLFDEAIVQRDNAYYLKRDYKGYHNVNGALFLEQSCDLKNRPLLYMIYGHNMKTGAMFGILRNWENPIFYHQNPFLHFEALYEEGDYVIFSVGIVSETVLEKGLFIYAMPDEATAKEELSGLIRELESASIYTNHIEVSNEDQLLLLVTCDGKEDERRVVAARRVRDGEALEDLRRIVQTNQKKR